MVLVGCLQQTAIVASPKGPVQSRTIHPPKGHLNEVLEVEILGGQARPIASPRAGDMQEVQAAAHRASLRLSVTMRARKQLQAQSKTGTKDVRGLTPACLAA